MKNQTIFFQSLGCPKNLVDTEVMLGIAGKNNYQIVTAPEDAKVIVINTCSFINDSKSESIDAILEAANQKKTGICERLIVTGCLPQRYKADLKVSFPEVDAFVGTGQYANLLEFIDGKREDDVEFRHPRYIHNEHTPRINTQPNHRAYLKIAEGCMKHCSFCIIPKIRGALRSRTIPSLLAEANALVDQGVKELNLICQDLTDYGKDLEDKPTLLDLLKALVQIENLKWVRLFYVYPDDLSDELLSFIAREPKICKYIDMPIQHVSDRILQLMNRKVRGQEIRERILRLRSLVPSIAFRSTVMVGYPSETEEEFNELKAFVEEMEFDHLGVFAFSREEGTASYYHADPVDEETKERRRNTLMEIQQKISEKKLKQYQGRTLEVLVDGPSQDTPFLWEGRHAGQAPDIDGQVILHSGNYKSGEILQVKIDRTLEYDLVGSAPVS